MQNTSSSGLSWEVKDTCLTPRYLQTELFECLEDGSIGLPPSCPLPEETEAIYSILHPG
ncbi:hypothetical protein DPMN_131473 [Dreissena polymorpha]|uniref:Uncharacterized protein n=1 Tax=Dreissena polymorpha TaxID=45954 RepID=A0A9D4K208_DREPO|nr:hypothetical protein DPMN_131473 [Dreissena polymorpha]